MYIPYTIALRRRCRSFGAFNPTLPQNIEIYLPKLDIISWSLVDYSNLATFEERLLTRIINETVMDNDLLLYGLAVCCHNGHYNNASILLDYLKPDNAIDRSYKALVESIIFERQGNMDLSLSTLRKAEEGFASVGDKLGLTSTKINIGLIYEKKLLLDDARTILSDAIVLAQAQNLHVERFQATNNIGLVLEKGSRIEEAIFTFEQVAKELENKIFIEKAAILTNWGIALSILSQYDDAIKKFKGSLEIDRVFHNREGEEKNLVSIGQAYLDWYNLSHETNLLYQAKLLLEAEEAVLEEVEAPTIKSTYYGQMGQMYLELQELEKSKEFFIRSWNISRTVKGWEWKASLLEVEYLIVNALIDSRKGKNKAAADQYKTIATQLSTLNYSDASLYYSFLGDIQLAENNLKIGNALQSISGLMAVINKLQILAKNSTKNNSLNSLCNFWVNYCKLQLALLDLTRFENLRNIDLAVDRLQDATGLLDELSKQSWGNDADLILAYKAYLKSKQKQLEGESHLVEDQSIDNVVNFYRKARLLIEDAIFAFRQINRDDLVANLEVEKTLWWARRLILEEHIDQAYQVLSDKLENLTGQESSYITERLKYYYLQLKQRSTLVPIMPVLPPPATLTNVEGNLLFADSIKQAIKCECNLPNPIEIEQMVMLDFWVQLDEKSISHGISFSMEFSGGLIGKVSSTYIKSGKHKIAILVKASPMAGCQEVNVDLKIKRNSTDTEDIIINHRLGSIYIFKAPINIDLHFIKSSNEYQVKFSTPSCGDLSSIIRLPYQQDDLNVLLKLIGSGSLSLDGFSTRERQSLKSLGFLNEGKIISSYLQVIGKRLYAELFPGDIKSMVHNVLGNAQSEHQKCTLRLLFDGESIEFARYPWELLHDSTRFVLASGAVELVRHITYPEPYSIPHLTRPLKLLYVAPRPQTRDALPTKFEFGAMEDGLTRFSQNDFVSIKELETGSFEDFVKELSVQNYHILHFDGLGAFGKQCNNCRKLNSEHVPACLQCGNQIGEMQSQGYLVFEDKDGNPDLIGADVLENVLYGSSFIIAVLSACQSSELGSASVFQGIGPALIRTGIPAIIAMQALIQTDDARKFINIFYHSLERYGSVSKAVANSRKILFHRGGWFIPTLYLRSYNGEVNLFS